MTEQVHDDEPLLEQMMQDLASADPIYQPTKYWRFYQDQFLPYLKARGLKDFRRTRDMTGAEVFASFGASDWLEEAIQTRRTRRRVWERAPRWIPGVPAMRRALEAGYAALSRPLIDASPTLEAWRELRFGFTRSEGERSGAHDLADLSVSLFGNPEDAFQSGENWYTTLTLYYYLRYAYASRFVDFDGISSLAELGSGSGKQAEVFAKLHPQLSLCLFDLPPQLYVSHQYLSSVFPERVAPYSQCRDMHDLEKLEPGRIYHFGNWRMPLLRTRAVNLFWNAASFAEMEPSIVAAYLADVRTSTDSVYLMQRMKGKRPKGQKGHGVIESTTLEHYREGLQDFVLEDLSPVRMPDASTMHHYDESFWQRGS